MVFAASAAELPPSIREAIEKTLRRSTQGRSAQLGREALTLAGAGRSAEAAAKLRDAAVVERAFGSGAAQNAALEFEHMSGLLQSHRLEVLRALGEPSFDDIVKELAPEHRELVQQISQAATHVHGVNLVNAEVKSFTTAFYDAAAHSGIHLGDSEFWDDWIKTAPGWRVFLAGSGADEPLAMELKKRLESKGFKVFFYKWCAPPPVLCAHGTVGEYFASAGQALVLHTDAASRSAFLPFEMAAIQRLQKGQALFIMVTPAEIIHAAERGVETATAIVVRAGMKQVANQQ